MKLIVVLALSIFGIGSAFAMEKQCLFLTTKQARAAYDKIVKKKKGASMLVLDRYCEFCGDDYPKPILVDTLNLAISGNKSFIYLNGERIDLAYHFLDGENLALLVNCPVYAVSRLL